MSGYFDLKNSVFCVHSFPDLGITTQQRFWFCLLISISHWWNVSESDWHMIIAGWGRHSVELFNWKTKQQCILNEDFSGVNVMGSLGSWIVKALTICNYCQAFECYKTFYYISLMEEQKLEWSKSSFFRIVKCLWIIQE